MPGAKDGMKFIDKFHGQADPPPPSISGQPGAGNEALDYAVIEQWEKETGRKWADEKWIESPPGWLQTQPDGLVKSGIATSESWPEPRDLIFTHQVALDNPPEYPVLLAPAAEDTDDSTGFSEGSVVTLAEHLKMGRDICERRKRNANARLQRLADKRACHWSCLMAAAIDVCGEELMLKCTMPEPDLSFTFDTERVTLTFRPFNRSTFYFVMACTLRKMENESRDYESPWALVRGPGHKPFAVHQDWRPTADELKPHAEERAYTVSEAVHLTFLQSGGYDDAVARQIKMQQRDAKESVR